MSEFEKGDLVQRKWLSARKGIGIVTSVHDDEAENWSCSIYVKWLSGVNAGHIDLRYQLNQLKRLEADNENR